MGLKNIQCSAECSSHREIATRLHLELICLSVLSPSVVSYLEMDKT